MMLARSQQKMNEFFLLKVLNESPIGKSLYKNNGIAFFYPCISVSFYKSFFQHFIGNEFLFMRQVFPLPTCLLPDQDSNLAPTTSGVCVLPLSYCGLTVVHHGYYFDEV